MRIIFMQLACQNFYNTTHGVIQMSFHGKFTQRKIFHYTKPRKPPPKQVKIIHTLSRTIDNPKYKMLNLKLTNYIAKHSDKYKIQKCAV